MEMNRIFITFLLNSNENPVQFRFFYIKIDSKNVNDLCSTENPKKRKKISQFTDGNTKKIVCLASDIMLF